MLNILSNPFQHLDTDDLLIRVTIVGVILAFRELTQEALRDVSAGDQGLVETGLTNVWLLTLFKVVNNIERHC